MQGDARSATVRPAPPPGPYLVAGLSVAGSAAARALCRYAGPSSVTGWDASGAPQVEAERSRLEAAGGRVVRGDGLDAFEADPPPRCLVKSPGIPSGLPLLAAARGAGAEVIDELELGWRLSPSRLLAVTGTNGKSTTVALAQALLRAAGHDTLLGGSGRSIPPLSALAEEKAEWIACEVTSYQLEGCPELLPELAVLTNLTRDHLHRHGTMEAYADCKRRLFVRGDRAVPLAVVNLDDALGRRVAAEVDERGGRALGYGTGPAAAWRVTACRWELTGGDVAIETPAGSLALRTRLPGHHNALNLAAGVAVGFALGLDPEAIRAALESFEPVPGRFEVIDSPHPFDVVVDLAHSHDALRQVGATARAIVDSRPGGRLIMVTSTAGTHDPPKRPLMGREVASAADQVIFTTGALYGEDPEAIMAGLVDGARRVPGASFEVEPDRGAAMRMGFEAAGPGDIVLVTGRGDLQTLSDDLTGAGPAFDDRVVARRLLAELPAATGPAR